MVIKVKKVIICLSALAALAGLALYFHAPKSSARPQADAIFPALAEDETLQNDLATYKEIFAAQRKRDWKAADALAPSLNDRMLMGHVLAERYADSRYKPAYTELAQWLNQYADLPQAPSLRAMARRMRPADKSLPPVASISSPRQRAGAAHAPSILRNAPFYTTWRAGIDAYRQGHYEIASTRFIALLSRDLPYADRSAVNFWAWRAYKADGKSALAAPYLKAAAEGRYSFYAIMARQAMRLGLGITHDTPALEDEQREGLLALAPLRRAKALVALGRTDLAEKEVTLAYARTRDGDVLKLAGEWNLASLQMRLGATLPENDASRVAALYPTPAWQSKNPVNPALLFAIARQESQFDEKAKSPAGAMGIMQLMPGTAHSMARLTKGFNTAELRHRLYEAQANVELGESYIRHLMQLDAVGKNMVFLLASYNAGPGNLIAWKKSLDYRHDPLLFIEMIPATQTRNYVQSVFANYWIYSSLLGDGLASVRNLLAQRWPSYNSGTAETAGL